MSPDRTSRPNPRRALQAALAVLSVLLAAPAHAQRHGGPGGGGQPGPPMGGGGLGNGFVGNSVTPFDAGNRRLGTPTAPTIRVEPQLGPPSRWWDDKRTIKHLGLRNDQQRRMDDIFETNRQTLATLYSNLQREEARLISLPPGDLQDESKIFAAIDRVAQAHSDLDKARAHILLQIRQQMDPQQLSLLDRDMASLR